MNCLLGFAETIYKLTQSKWQQSQGVSHYDFGAKNIIVLSSESASDQTNNRMLLCILTFIFPILNRLFVRCIFKENIIFVIPSKCSNFAVFKN